MTQIRLIPNKLKGEVEIPPSKSLAHRAIICASLAKGESIISNIDYSEDIIATICAVKSLGANIKQVDNTLYIKGIEAQVNNNIQIDCNESGSTLRFFVPISTLFANTVNFIGQGNLGKRPLTAFYEIFDKQSIKYSYKEQELDLNIQGTIKPDTFTLRGDISSQFITGLLFTLPLLQGDSKIIITTALESKGYIDLTLQMLEMFGITIENQDYQTFIIKGNQNYKPTNYKVEGDFSQAAFFLIAGALGNDITVKNLNPHSYQADKEVIELLRKIGANIKVTDTHIKATKNELKNIVMDGSECPDIVPIMALILSVCIGASEINNVARLRIKECDRLSAINLELSKLGAKIQEFSDSLKIDGVRELIAHKEISSHKDHRIAMMIAIAVTICQNEIILHDPECVAKSYPSFWEDYQSLGGIIEYLEEANE
ncbi:3-phosphoshikimate 1-carboxyvinyltransferase [Candidatus Epulonipiscioides gigas]|nr:3-phosphoshikimate 1-carboxyvinyltransferase [Epulopiscium sp. SCG-C07WGA-EpuloA2]